MKVLKKWAIYLAVYVLMSIGAVMAVQHSVWLNPPYSRPLINRFIEKMSSHNNGIALLFNRCDSKLFQEHVLSKCSGILFLKKRIRFYRSNGIQGKSPGCGSLLVAYGEDNLNVLKQCPLKGHLLIPITN